MIASRSPVEVSSLKKVKSFSILDRRRSTNSSKSASSNLRKFLYSFGSSWLLQWPCSECFVNHGFTQYVPSTLTQISSRYFKVSLLASPYPFRRAISIFRNLLHRSGSARMLWTAMMIGPPVCVPPRIRSNQHRPQGNNRMYIASTSVVVGSQSWRACGFIVVFDISVVNVVSIIALWGHDESLADGRTTIAGANFYAPLSPNTITTASKCHPLSPPIASHSLPPVVGALYRLDGTPP